MKIRPAIRNDLDRLREIDGTVEAGEYLHVEKTGEGLEMSIKIEPRPLREKLIEPNRIHDDLSFAVKQITEGIDEGTVLVADHEGAVVALAVAQPRPEVGTVQLLDVRVDYDFRRQGLATAMLFQIVQESREAGHRAVCAEARANHFAANQMLLKCGFEMSGIDVRRRSNHDLIKEAATLFWYAELR